MPGTAHRVPTRVRLPPPIPTWRGPQSRYEQLGQRLPSPIVELNRAVSMAFGPAEGLVIIDALDLGAIAPAPSLAAERARRPAGESSAGSTRHARSSSARRR